MSSEIDISDDFSNITYGSTDKKNPVTIYINYKTIVFARYEENCNQRTTFKLREQIRKAVKRTINSNNFFSDKFIIDTKMAENGLSVSKPTFLSAQIVLMQKSDNIEPLKNCEAFCKLISDEITKGIRNIADGNGLIITKDRFLKGEQCNISI